ncbi:MAG: type II toxin-antitoxin system RelE/ParE family toxin [Planctomycetota bacterium]
MSYRVEYGSSFLDAVKTRVAYLRATGASEDAIERWFANLFDLIDGLYTMPKRGPVAEAQTTTYGFEVRRLVFGDHLIYYRVDEERHAVGVLFLMYGAQQSQ